MKPFITSLVATAVLVSAVLFPQAASAAAGSGNASLSVSGGSHEVGSTFNVTVSETSSEPVVAVDASLTYDASKLECLGVSGGTAFPTAYQNSCGGGSISIARGTQGTTVTGPQTVAVVSFKALAGSGSTEIKAANSAEIDNTSVQNVCNNTCAGGAVLATHSFTTPAPAPAPAQNTGGGTSAPATNQNNAQNTRAANGTNNVGSDQTAEAPATNEVKSAEEQKTQEPQAENLSADSQKSSNVFGWILFMLILLSAGAAIARRYRSGKPGLLVAPAKEDAGKKAAERPAVAATTKIKKSEKKPVAKKRAGKKTRK